MCGDMEVLIRLETEADYREVENVTREAFWNVYSPDVWNIICCI